MRVRILWIGKTKERYALEGAKKYLGLLKPFAEIEIVEIKERKGIDHGEARRREGEGVLKRSSSFVLLDERGRALGSLQFASFLRERRAIDFVLGGPFGVSDEVRRAASDILSLSKMTLTHDMSRLLLLEQLYRAVMINAGRRYHN